MAYARLFEENCASKAEFFCNVRDFLCKLDGTYHDYSTTGIGWTLHDADYAVDADNVDTNDWFVIKSTGETELDTLYFLIDWSASDSMAIWNYLTWDNTTHTGSTQKGGTASSLAFPSTLTDVPLSVYGDLNSVMVLCPITETYTDYRTMCFGKLDKPWQGVGDDIVTSTSSVSSGSDVSITVDSVPSTWAVDREIYLWTTTENTSTCKCEKTKIKTLVSSTITCDLTNSYTANFRLSEHFGYFVPYGSSMASFYTFLSQDGGSDLISLQTETYNYVIGGYEDRVTLISPALTSPNGLYGILRNTYFSASTTIQNGDTLIDYDDTEYTHFKTYTSTHLVFKEI